MQHHSSIRLVYVIGCGRSGSTLLDTIMGNHPDIVSLGEMQRMGQPHYYEHGYCSCGQPLKACPFWCDVLRQWYQHPAVRDLQAYRELQDHFERYHQLPRLFAETRRTSELFQQYATQTRALFEAILEVSGKQIIVDTSKLPMRGLAFSLIPGIDLHVLHLVRDGRGVAWSKKKLVQRRSDGSHDTKPYPVWLSARIWVVTNIMAYLVRRRLHPERAMLCRYEDMVERSAQTLTTIGNFIGCDLSEVIAAILTRTPLTSGHTMGGNRMRLSGNIRLQPDVEWKEKLSPPERLIFYTLAGWLLHRFGYSGVVHMRERELILDH